MHAYEDTKDMAIAVAPAESGLSLLDHELNRMEKILALAEQRLTPVILTPIPTIETMEEPTAAPSPLRERGERLTSQCRRWERLLDCLDL